MKGVHVVHHKLDAKNYKDSVPTLDWVQQEEGHVDPKLKKKHKLTTSTIPEGYADMFLIFK